LGRGPPSDLGKNQTLRPQSASPAGGQHGNIPSGSASLCSTPHALTLSLDSPPSARASRRLGLLPPAGLQPVWSRPAQRRSPERPTGCRPTALPLHPADQPPVARPSCAAAPSPQPRSPHCAATEPPSSCHPAPSSQRRAKPPLSPQCRAALCLAASAEPSRRPATQAGRPHRGITELVAYRLPPLYFVHCHCASKVLMFCQLVNFVGNFMIWVLNLDQFCMQCHCFL
jgi:hypothetical protein